MLVVLVILVLQLLSEPYRFVEAIKVHEWKQVIQQERDALMRNVM